MVSIHKYLSIFPLYSTHLFLLATLLCIAACSNKKDMASKPIAITPSERFVASPALNEPPIIILSPSSGNIPKHTQTNALPTKNTNKKTSSYTTNNTSAHQGNYAVQIGAFSSSTLANRAANQARQNAPALLLNTKTNIDIIQKDGKSLYRVKLAGLNANSATQACSELKQKQFACIVTR